MDEQILTSSFALIFGAAHAIEPGHGKTALFTYLASGKCSWRDGVMIALSSAITHSLVVLLIATASHSLLSNAENIGDQITFWLKIVASSIIISMGIYIFSKRAPSSCSHCESHHGHLHNHEHSHPSIQTKKSLFASGVLGFATGLIPCPSVVVAYLAGVSTGNLGMGLEVVLYFAFGMAISLLSVVLLFSIFGKQFNNFLERKEWGVPWNKIQGSLFVIIGLVSYFL